MRDQDIGLFLGLIEKRLVELLTVQAYLDVQVEVQKSGGLGGGSGSQNLGGQGLGDELIYPQLVYPSYRATPPPAWLMLPSWFWARARRTFQRRWHRLSSLTISEAHRAGRRSRGRRLCGGQGGSE